MPSQSAPQYDPAVEYQKGVDAYQAKDFKSAVAAFKRVTSAVPRNAPAQYLLGSSYMAMSDFKKAKKPLEQAIRQLHPYTVPEIVAVPVVAGFAPYLRWVADETTPPMVA